MAKYFTILCCIILCGCNKGLMQAEKKLNPIVARRIMVVIMPNEELVHSWAGFLSVCDSVFKASGIAKTAVVLDKDDFRDGKDAEKFLEETLKMPVINFRPDCLVIISPQKRKSYANSISVEYSAYLMPVDIPNALALDFSSNEAQVPPQFLGVIDLTSTGRKENDSENGREEAGKFIVLLKKNISTVL